MKILKRGKDPKEDKWRGRCPNCKSEMEAARNEVQVEWDQKEQGEFGRARCPVCGNEMIFYPVKR